MIRVLKQVQREAREARRWYAQRDPDVARAFANAIAAAITAIAESPHRCAMQADGMRYCYVRRFPYTIVYMIESSETVAIVAIAHQRRRPGYWSNRVSRPA